MRRAATGIALVLVLVLVRPAAGIAADVIVIRPLETATTGTLGVGAAATFAVEGGPGDYLRGSVSVRSGGITVDVVTGDGRPLRRLATGATGTVTFRIVAPPPDGARLRLRATAPGSVASLTIAARIAPQAQTAAPRRYLSPAVAALAERLAAGGDTRAFWERVAAAGTPLVEPASDGHVVVTFLARGARRNVRLFGAPSGDHEDLERLGGSDTWFRSFVVPSSTRLSYQLAVDVPELPSSDAERRAAILATSRADPFNRHPWPADAPDPYNQESVLELPEAPIQPGLEPQGNPKGTLSTFRIASGRLGNERTITLYRPPGFDPARSDNALLVLFDAEPYLTKVPTPTILDNLIAQKRIPPTIAVFVSPIDGETRARELPGNADFADFVAGDLLARVRRETGAVVPAARTIIAGSSYGGLAAVTVALHHPQAFGTAVSLSGSFWWHPPSAPADQPNHVAAWVARQPARAVRVYLTAGLFETAHRGMAGILETSRHLRDVLVAKGYAVTYREYASGHDYVVWRGALADALIALWR